MNIQNPSPAQETLCILVSLGLITAKESETVKQLENSAGHLRSAINAAETIHLHVKVDDTDLLPVNDFIDAGAQLDHQKPGFVKYRFPGEVNAIFSHIKVAQEELAETESNRRPRPFLDHIGIDLREDTPANRELFDALPKLGGTMEWGHAAQGSSGKPVYCCHVEVAEKHWLYPKENGCPGIPLEFAFGPLIVNIDSSGCDLRPANPLTTAPDAIPTCEARSACSQVGKEQPEPAAD